MMPELRNGCPGKQCMDLPSSAGVMRRRHTPAGIASSAGTHLSGQKSDERQSHPLAESKRFQELCLGVLKCGIDCVYCGNRQVHTSFCGWLMRVGSRPRDYTRISANRS